MSPLPPLSNHPVDVGQRSETAILAAFVDHGFQVWLPWGTNQRYDMILEVRDRFLRVQCKTGRLRHGAVEFKAHSVRVNTKANFTRDYFGEIEYFAVYCAATSNVYIVPCDAATPKSVVALRIDPPRNGQSKRVRWAADYEIERFKP
jgi:hypothetical protein